MVSDEAQGYPVAHDIFTPQPVKNASVFLVKEVLHDWPDAYSLRLLTHLRQAATPSTRLVLLEAVIPYACHGTSAVLDELDDEGSGIPGLSLATTKENRYARDMAVRSVSSPQAVGRQS